MLRNCFKKVISATLSLMLLFSMAFGTMNLTASAENGEAAAVQALKDAWQQMSLVETSEYDWLYYHNSNGWTGNYIQRDSFNVDVLPAGATHSNVGDFYFSTNLNITNPDSNTGKQPLLQYAVNEWATTGDLNPRDYQDIYVYMYVKSVTGTVTLTPYFEGPWPFPNVKLTAITLNSDSVGKWIKISVKELYPGGYSAFANDLNSNIACVRFILSDDAEGEVIFGSVMTEKSATLPEGSENWSNVDWFFNTEDLSAYSNIDNVVAARAALKAEIEGTVDYKIEVLKREWQKMTVPISSQFNHFFYHDGSNFATISPRNAYNATVIPYSQYEFGDYYVDYNLADASAPTTAQMLLFGTTEWAGQGPEDLSQYSDMYFYLYIERVYTEGTMWPMMYGIDQGNDWFGKDSAGVKGIEISKAKENTWIKVSAADIYEGGYNAICAKLKNGLTIFRLQLSDNVDADIKLGNVVFVGNTAIPQESAAYNNADWVFKAREAINSGLYGNTEGLAAAADALEAVVIGTDDYTVATLKNEWNNLSGPASIFYPMAYHAEYDDGRGANFNDHYLPYTRYDQATVPYSASYEMLGEYYSEFNLSVADQAAHLIGFFGASDLRYGSADLTEYSDLYFNLYIEDVTAAGTITPILINYNETTYQEYTLEGTPIEITDANKGKWIKVDSASIIEGGYAKLAETLQNNLNIVRLKVSDGINANVVLGSVVLTGGKASLPNRNTNESWMQAANALDLTKYSGAETFEAILSTNRAGHCCSEETCSVLDLVRLKKYLASNGNGTVVINKLAADINFDGEIDSIDLSSIRKILLLQ